MHLFAIGFYYYWWIGFDGGRCIRSFVIVVVAAAGCRSETDIDDIGNHNTDKRSQNNIDIENETKTTNIFIIVNSNNNC
jgi:hypothetical protein